MPVLHYGGLAFFHLPCFVMMPVYKKILIVLLFCCSSGWLLAANFTNIQSGNWNDAAIWQITAGTDADGIPDADDNVTLSSLNVGLSQNESCNNLTHPGAAVQALSCAANYLDVYGTLTFTNTPTSHNVITSSTAGSGIRFTGAGRSPLMAGGTTVGTGYSVEVACSGTSTLSNTALQLANFTLSSGTLNVTNELRLATSGNVYIGSGATMNLSATLGRTSASLGTYCNAITVDGVLETSAPVISANTIAINGTFRVKTTSAIVSDPNTSEWTYGGGAVLEYNAAGECLMGAEIDRYVFSSADNPVINTLRVNRSGGGNAVQTNFKTPRMQNLDFVSGKVRCNGTPVVIVAGGSISGAGNGNYVITASTFAGLRREGMGSGDFHIGTAAAYLPVTAFNNTGATDVFTAHVTTTTPSCVAANHSVTATWDIAEAVAGGSNVTLSLDYANAATGIDFSAATAKVIHCTGSVVDYANGSVSGTVASGGGFTVFSPFGISSDPALPLELISFTGKAAGAVNVVSWETLSEKNLEWHIVERSADGIHWKEAGRTPAFNGGLRAHRYTWTDAAPFARTYYRLRSTGRDAVESVGPSIEVLRAEDELAITQLYPSPVSDLLNVQFTNHHEEVVEMEVSDADGRIVAQKTVQARRGVQTATVEVQTLPSGVYQIRCRNAEQTTRLVRFVKQ